MGWRSQLPTYLIVTVVAVLIWLWAAGETRETGERTFLVQFTTQFPADHIVTPKETTISVEIEGSRSALRSAPAMGSPIVLTLDAGLGDHAVDLVRLLNNHPDLRDARVSVISTDPPSQDVTIHKLVSATVRVEDPDLGPEVDLAPNAGLEPCRVKLLPGRTDLVDDEQDARRDIRGEGMAHVPVPQHERGLESAPAEIRGDQVHIDRPPHPLGIVDPAPAMRTVRHVAILALPSGRRLRAALPLDESVLERLAIDTWIVEELVAGRAEATLLELAAWLEPAVRRRLEQSRQIGAPRRSEATVIANMARCTHDPLPAQSGIERSLGAAKPVVGLLFAQGGVTALAGPYLDRVGKRALDQLT